MGGKKLEKEDWVVHKLEEGVLLELMTEGSP